MRALALHWLVSVAFGALVAQWAGEATGSPRYLVSRWTLADGLPQSSPNSLAIDARGYLWVGTELGLARFDGTSFKVWDTRHGLPGERVVRLLPTQAGLWVATEPAALSLFSDGVFHPVFPNRTVLALAVDRQGNVWIGTPEESYIVERGGPLAAFATADAPRGVTAWLNDGAGELLAASIRGVSRLDADGSWHTTPLGPLQPPVQGLARVDGGLLAAARNGFWRLTDGRWTLVEPGTNIHAGIAPSGDGGAWLWSLEGGLLRFSEGGVERVGDLGSSHAVFAALPDGADTLWLGIADEGLLRLQRPLFASMTSADGLPMGAVHGLLQAPDGALWAGSLDAGIARITAGGVQSFGPPEGLPGHQVSSIGVGPAGEIWVGTQHDLLTFMDGRFEPLRISGQAGQGWPLVSEIIPGPDGSTLFASGGGVYAYRQGTAREIIAGGAVAGLEFIYRDRKGTLWIGGDGICAHRPSGLQCYSGGDGLPPHYARCAFEAPGGELWFCTYGGGLCRLEEDRRFRCVSEEQGLPHRTVHNVLLDDLGWLWLPSNRGLGRLRLEELQRAFRDPGYTMRADVFGLDDGLPNLEFNGGVPPRGIELDDGRLALPTMAGVAFVDPASVASATGSAPRVDLQPLLVNGVDTEPAPDLVLGPGTERIEFRYTALLPRDPESVRFRYRLTGNDDGWLADAGSRSATYTGLPPGRYRFEVQASAGSGPWSASANLPLELKPYFWQTWWFAAVIAAGIVALAGMLLHLRVQRAVALERLRLRIATDLHDDLGSELSGVSLASALLRDRDDLPESTRRSLAEIRDSAGQLLPRMRDIVWLIDPEKEGSGPLVERLRSVAASLTAGMELEFCRNAGDRRLRLGMTGRRDLLLLYRELLTNIARHSGAARVEVRVELDDDRLLLEVRDDGRGFDPDREVTGSGLRNMRRRAQSMGADFKLESAPGAGTTVRLELPLTRSGRGRRRYRPPS